MASIQSLGIVHLDLKSANVLLEQIQTGENEYELNGKFNFLFFLKNEKKIN